MQVFTGTWNLHAKAFPSNLADWVLPEQDVYAIGTEECERSIEASVVFSSKARWTRCLADLLGEGYVELAQQTLQAIHIVVFVRARLFPYCHHIEHGAVATGIGSVMGNKGGVAIGFDIGATSLLFINAHFAAHQNAVAQRNDDYHKILSKLDFKAKLRVSRAQAAAAANGAANPAVVAAAAAAFSDAGRDRERRREECVTSRFDRVWFMGDLNYRVGGNRRMVDALVARNMIEVMLANDQLNVARENGQVFEGFIEGEIRFRPTYKFDANSDVYDSSKKRRSVAAAAAAANDTTNSAPARSGEQGCILHVTRVSLLTFVFCPFVLVRALQNSLVH